MKPKPYEPPAAFKRALEDRHKGSGQRENAEAAVVTKKRRASQVEQLIESALQPGRFVPYSASYSFSAELGPVRERIAELVSTDPSQAVALYETFLAGCYEKADEVDDSDGSFAQFVGELFCGWIKARRASGADPAETAARLLGWMEDDPHGFCYAVEKDAAKAFDKVGLAAFVKRVRGCFDAAAARGDSLNPDHARWRWGATLRTLYLEQKNVQAYVALAEETGLTAHDCHAVATMLVSRRKVEDALVWVVRGIDLARKAKRGSPAEHDLPKLKRALLTKLGRGDEALDAAWAEYREYPSKYAYDDLMKYVPRAECPGWHEKAIEAAEGADLQSVIELLLDTKELDRLVALVRRTKDEALERVSHYATEPAAKKLEKVHPDAPARLWRAQGMRLVKGKKSKYYDAALSNFERARNCFEKAGRAADWQRLVKVVRSQHRRKAGFMAGFEAIVANSGPSVKKSFLDRARARWSHDGRPRGQG